MPREDDSQELRRRVEESIETVLDAIAPGWVQKGNIAYLSPKNQKDLGSYTVSLADGKMPRGCWYRFSQSIGGGAIELIAYQLWGRKDAYKEAFSWVREFFGIQRSEETPEAKAARIAHQKEEAERREARRRQDEAKKAENDARRTSSAEQVWSETVPLLGTKGEGYFVGRGIPGVAVWPWNPDSVIRFHPALSFEPDPDRGKFPCVVCKVVDAFGDFLAVWQIYLDRDRAIKADLTPSPKIGRGPATGGAVRIGGDGEDIDGCEGVETALGAWFLSRHRRPCWSFLSTSGMKNFEPPPFLKKVRIWQDGDRAVLGRDGIILPPPGMNAAQMLHVKLKTIGLPCTINAMTREGDALDLWNTMRRYEERAA